MPNGITFAGVPAVLDFNRKIERFVAERWPESRWPFAQSRDNLPPSASPFAGNDMLDRFRLPYPDVPAPRINEVIIPTGASRYGRGLFLFGREAMAHIASVTWGYSGDLSQLPTRWSNGEMTGEAPNELRIEYENVFTWKMFAMSPVLLDGSGDNELWMVPLVDWRAIWLRTPAEISLAQGDNWGALFSELDSKEFLSNPGAVDPRYGVPDRETFADPGVSAGILIDAALLSVGRRAVPSNSQRRLVPWTAQQSKNAIDQNELKPWMGSNTPSRPLPYWIHLNFRTAVDHFGQCGDMSFKRTSTVGGQTRGSHEITIYTPWYAQYFRTIGTGGGSPIIEDDWNTVTDPHYARQKLVDDFFSWMEGVPKYEYSLPGVQEWTLNGNDDYISIRVGGTDNLDSVSTHVRSLPDDFHPLVFLGQQPDIYVHPNDSAMFITMEPSQEGTDWLSAQITRMDGYYAGDDIRQVLIKTTRSECSPPYLPYTKLLAHYQCEQGWYANPSIDELPAWEIKAELKEILKATDEDGVCKFDMIRSNFPHVGEPPGMTKTMGGDWEVAFKNPWKLDGLCESKVVLRWIDGKCKAEPCQSACQVNYLTGAGWMYSPQYICPPGCQCPPLPTDSPSGPETRILQCIPGDSETGWEVVKVEKRRARWIRFPYKVDYPSDVQVAEFWDGDDPMECEQDVAVDYPLGAPTEDADVVACYDPKGYRYKAVSTTSSMLGPTVDVDVLSAVAFAGCSINYVRQKVKTWHAGPPIFGTTEPVFQSVDVITSVSMIAPVPACVDVCQYEWNGSVWLQTSTCGSGSGCSCQSQYPQPPGPGDPTVLTFPCVRDDGQTPAPGRIEFGRANIYVCSFASTVPDTIPLVECDDPTTPPTSP